MDNKIEEIKKLIEENQCQQALELVEKELTKFPDNVELYFLQAKSKLIWEFPLEEVISDYTKAIELDPNRPDYYIWCGTAKYNLERYEEAITDYEKAIELNPNEIWAYYNKGNAIVQVKQLVTFLHTLFRC